MFPNFFEYIFHPRHSSTHLNFAQKHSYFKRSHRKAYKYITDPEIS